MSDFHRVPVPSFPRYSVDREGNVYGPRAKDHPLRAGFDTDGYLQFRPMLRGRPTSCKVHRAVCEAFHGPASAPGMSVLHGDGDRTNNRPDNLRWGTQLENELDKRKHDRHLPGSRNHMHKLVEVQVEEIRRRLAAGATGESLARAYGVSRQTIWAIKHRRMWRHVA